MIHSFQGISKYLAPSVRPPVFLSSVCLPVAQSVCSSVVLRIRLCEVCVRCVCPAHSSWYTGQDTSHNSLITLQTGLLQHLLTVSSQLCSTFVNKHLLFKLTICLSLFHIIDIHLDLKKN